MKSIRHILVAVFLGLLLAVGTWQVADAPPYDENSIPDRDEGVPAFLGETHLPNADGRFEEVNTPIPPTTEEMGTSPEPVSPTSTLETETDSCSTPVVGSGNFVWPTDNHTLSGNDYGPGHPGIDITAGEGSPVYAADAGLVVAEGNDAGGYGNVIQIDHGDGYLTVYAHLSAIGVRMCQSVQAGQWIGAAGSTGDARGAHLHFEVALDNLYINPWDVLP